MTTLPYNTPETPLERKTPLPTARRIAWLILGACILFGAGGILWLGVIYILSFVELPSQYAAFARTISAAEDMAIIKQACLSLTRIDESELMARRNWVILAPALGLSLAAIAGALSVWLLIILKRIEKHL
jgi:Zn-dependent membrane protease YugP